MNGNLAYLQNDVWEELIDGKVIAMSPRPTTDHYHVSFNIAYIFTTYLRGKRCTPFGDGVDLYLTETDRFIPDGMVVCDTEKIKRDGVHGAPDLVVEVLSPSTAKHDRGRKKQVYEQCGVSEYWIVDPANKTLEQYLLQQGAFTLHEVYAIYPDYMLDKMTEEERAALPASFRCSLFEDLDIVLEDIFDRVL
ncbi:MAG: Uma2 family endonuclease [Flavonifractor sp.]|jgi:Uma2 family endonuclease|nr:Uma2 family endonuclease [Flavonifractor sp.]MCI9472414.1 Uma2 family endonuclease [Flavonifractor sp.]